MTVSFEAFYKMFMESKPNLIYEKEDLERRYTLDRIRGGRLITGAPRCREATMDQVKQAIRERTHIDIRDPSLGSDIDSSVVFLCSVGDIPNHQYEVRYGVSGALNISNYFD
ncbi:MAG: hypothetical protein HY512_00075 [Candidatus Aenigmarchaeota archaeon]|nr:hypothetical protein [Candidatus Aenigmarchaeota archaeon]